MLRHVRCHLPPAVTPLLLPATLRRLEAAHANDTLMERAGLAAAELALQLRQDDARPVLVVAGPGNNGGDAAVVARILGERGIAVTLAMVGDHSRRPADAETAFRKLEGTRAAVVEGVPAPDAAGLIVDGLFGIGLARGLTGPYAEAIAAINSAVDRRRIPVLALDCPSGLNAATGERTGPSVRASVTLTYIAAKPGLYTADGPDLCGEVMVDALGISATEIEALADGSLNDAAVLDEVLLPRAKNSHKGDFGSIGILGGAPGMTGAAILAGRSALKIGCGRVFIGLRDDRLAFDPCQPELMLRNPSGLAKAPLDALVCGPGLGTDRVADALLTDILQSPLPLVLDADALTLIGADGLAAARLRTRHPITVITPHPGEAARMLGVSVLELQRDRVGAARQLATEFNVWAALKGCGTVIASPRGPWWINESGNPLLASAGTGDVLAGLVGAFLAQKRAPEAALRAAVLLHGQAADALRARGLALGLVAGELIDEIRHLAAAHLQDRLPSAS